MSFQQAGIWVSDWLGVDGGESASAPGDRIESMFTAASGTAISRLRYFRSIKKENEDQYLVYISLGDRSNVIDTCEIGGGSTCSVGADDWLADDVSVVPRGSYREVQGASANSIILGVACRDSDVHVCGNGHSLTNVDVQIFSAFLTISDPVAPTLGTPTGDGWTAGGWASGTLPLAMASMDNTGIAATKIYADGSVVAVLQRSCAYDRPRPCSDEGVGAVGLPTVGLADGIHAISVGAVDAAGNETKVDRSAPLKVDNNAPEAVVDLVSPAPVSTVNRFSAHWSLPVDNGSPIVAARYQVCQAGVCGAVQTAPSLTEVDGLVLPVAGAGSVRVWLVDEVGHEAPGGAAQTVITYAPEPAPVPRPPNAVPNWPVPSVPSAPTGETPSTPAPPAPSVPAEKADAALRIRSIRVAGRRLEVRGSASSRASGRVTVRFRARSRPGGRSVTVTAKAAVRKRTFKAVLALPGSLNRTRSGIVTVSYSGDADTRAASRQSTVRWRG